MILTVPCGFPFPTPTCAAGDVRVGKEMAWKQLHLEVVRSCVIAIGRGEQRENRERKWNETSTLAAGIHLSILHWSWGSVLYPALVWFWRSLSTHLGSGKSVPHSCVLSEVTPIGLLFTTHCNSELVSPCRNLWWQKWGDSPGAPVIPRLVSDLMCLFYVRVCLFSAYWGAHLLEGLPVSGGFVADTQG